jgi:UDP-N-acetylmuramate--alanine ligase
MHSEALESTRYFVAGICGMGMCPLALLLHSRGCEVRGSDASIEGTAARSLRAAGVVVMDEASGLASLQGGDTLVYSTAISESHQLRKRARELGLQEFHRVDVLEAIARDYYVIAVAGTHGKTTTTGILGFVLEAAGWEPTIYVGGRILGFDTYFPPDLQNAHQVAGKPLLVVETDESDTSFLRLVPDVAVITNIDRDHLGAYNNSFEGLVRAFERFAIGCRDRGGVLIGFSDDGEVAHLVDRIPLRILYGSTNADAMVSYDELANVCRVIYEGRDTLFAMERGDEKTYLDAVAACLSCSALGMDFSTALRHASRFPGMERRLQQIGEARNVAVVSDHADHPTEIAASMRALRARYKQRRIVLVLQPHRYSRVTARLEDYGRAVAEAGLLVLLPIYAAGEQVRDVDDLNRSLRTVVRQTVGSKLAESMSRDSTLKWLLAQVEPGDVVTFMGPGDVNELAWHFCGLLTGDIAVQ